MRCTLEHRRHFYPWALFTIISHRISAYGAAGGKGAKNHNKRNHGVFISASFPLEKGETLYILVGHQGEDACPGVSPLTGKTGCSDWLTFVTLQWHIIDPDTITMPDTFHKNSTLYSSYASFRFWFTREISSPRRSAWESLLSLKTTSGWMLAQSGQVEEGVGEEPPTSLRWDERLCGRSEAHPKM